MLTGNCPIQLDVLGEGRLALASRPRRSFFGALKEKEEMESFGRIRL